MNDHFRALNSYYNKVYVLSVASAVKRRELFAQYFEGLDYEFYFGADKKDFSIAEAEAGNIFSEKLARQQHRFSKTMKHGEIACSWSHRMIYEDMLANQYERVLIFEDDAVPDIAMLARIPAILAEIPASCELLMWGWDKNERKGRFAGLKQLVYKIQHRLGLLKWNNTIINNLYARPYSKYLKKAGFHDYTYAYAVSRDGAQKLAKMQTPIQYIADNLLAHAATKEIVEGYIIWPQVFLHDSLPDGTHKDSYIR